VIETLAILTELQPDALIVQDLGIIKVVRDYFPSLPLHASTLMAATNSAAVGAFASMGLERVVLARELTIKEIGVICKKSDIEIEVFIHGAMCFSYSGLCLFSSFLGGKSGLRGRCVQPCRRQYTWETKGGSKGGARGGKAGSARGSGRQEVSESRGHTSDKGSYLFSMNDLGGLEAVPLLAEAGVASLKIEGRLRTAHYVSLVVQAYRMVMDADAADFPVVLKKAQALTAQAMSRKVGPGYFLTPQPLEAITPYHSGNAGLHLGQLESVQARKNGLYGSLTLKEGLEVGDRLRLHEEVSGERHSFSLAEMFKGREKVTLAVIGDIVHINLPAELVSSARHKIVVYKVDVRNQPQMSDEAFGLPSRQKMLEVVARAQSSQRSRIAAVCREVCLTEEKSAALLPLSQKGKGDGRMRTGQRKPGPVKVKLPLEWWLRTDSIKLLQGTLPFTPDRFLLPLDKNSVSQAGQLKRSLGQGVRHLTWCLPPLLFESELAPLQKQLSLLIRSGFKSFQLGHISQAWLFQGERVHLSCDYTVSVMNSQALAAVRHLGAEAAQLSIEADRTLLAAVLKSSRANGQQIRKGMTVYGAPPLFTARVAARHFQYDRVLTSPKGEAFTMHKKDGLVKTVPCRPFSLLPYLGELRDMGLDFAVVDLSHLPTSPQDMLALAERLSNVNRVSKLPSFNYLGELE
jgi:putative protease